MPEKYIWNDFSAGWCPSDDAINGRRNSLLAMENVCLDVNGRLSSSGGTLRLLSVFTNTAHSLYSKVINGTNFIYSADTTGLVFRNNTQIESGGSTTRACFNAAFNYVFGFSGNKRFKDTGAATTDLGIVKPSVGPTVVVGAAGVLTGDYEYCQINVLVNGTYQAKSARSVITTVSPNLQQVTVTPQDPATPGSTANEAWIFRRGVNLDTWYRIARVTTFGSFSDNLSDFDALALGITLNDFLLSVNSTDTPDAIIACVGPVYGRMIYFTAKQAIFSDRYSPDSYDSRTSIGLGGSSGSETFKWAIKIAKNTILVGTDRDVYILSGTYVQLPDGFLDVSLDPLGVSDPPIGTDVCLYQNSAVYMSKSGWVACSTSGQIINLCFPNIDFLYNGGTTYEYGPVTIDMTGATRYPCVISNSKLYTIETLGARAQDGATIGIHMEVYDFQRKYWRVAYPSLCPKMLYTQEDGKVIGFDDTDKFIKQYDVQGKYTLDDGSSTRQNIYALSPVLDDGKPNNLKELLSLEILGGTNSSLHGLILIINDDGHVGSDNTLSTIFLQDNAGYYSTEILRPARSAAAFTTPILHKRSQIQVTGNPNRLTLQRIMIYYDLKPESHVLFKTFNLGLDSVNKKRVRALNFLINTHGVDVTFTPTIDGVDGTTSTFNTARKQQVTHYFTTDVFGIDYSGTFLTSDYANLAPTAFELYESLPPDIVQILPQGKKFDQFGPIEVFKYGKLKELEFRLISFAGTAIPYAIYFEDSTLISGTITTVDSKEGVYHIDLTKTIAGTILRIELGPTSFLFHKLGLRVKANVSGKDTEMSWIDLLPKS